MISLKFNNIDLLKKLFSFFQKNKIDFISYAVSFFLIFSVFSAPFELKLINLILIFILISLDRNILRCFYQNLSENIGIIIFMLLCISSFILYVDNYNIFNNEKYDEINRPSVFKISTFSILTILLFSYEKFYTKTINLVINITTIILTFSLIMHYFVYEMSFITGTLFFNDLRNDALGPKNTMAIFLCLFLPYIIHNLTKDKNIKNLYIFVIFTLAIFYTFSLSAIIIYAAIFFLFFITLRKDYIILLSIIITIFFIISVIFDYTPKKFSELKHRTNIELYEIQNKIYDPEFELKRFNEIYKDKNVNFFTKFFSGSSYRTRYIQDALEGFLQKPFFGHGITNFQKNNIHYDNDGNIIRKPVTHNDIVQILYEQGLVGIFSFLYFTLFIIFKLLKKYKTGSEISLIGIIQILVLLFSVNFVNLIDHALFWVILSLNNVKNIKQNNKIKYYENL